MDMDDIFNMKEDEGATAMLATQKLEKREMMYNTQYERLLTADIPPHIQTAMLAFMLSIVRTIASMYPPGDIRSVMDFAVANEASYKPSDDPDKSLRAGEARAAAKICENLLSLGTISVIQPFRGTQNSDLFIAMALLSLTMSDNDDDHSADSQAVIDKYGTIEQITDEFIAADNQEARAGIAAKLTERLDLYLRPQIMPKKLTPQENLRFLAWLGYSSWKYLEHTVKSAANVH